MNAYDKLLEEARGRPFACIVGWPVEHSRSPALHGFWLKQHKIDGHYGRLPVEPNRAALEELVAFLRRTPNARGCNLTLPHKIEIMPLLDELLTAFVEQRRMKLPGSVYRPCYRLVS